MHGSHLVWVRGLKHQFIYKLNGWIKVAPRVGAWIETILNLTIKTLALSRTSCGCVD